MPRFALLLTAILISASNLPAQVTSFHFNFHLGGGSLKASKHGDFKGIWENGYNISGELTYRIICLRETELYPEYPRRVSMWPETHHADFYRLAAGLRYSLRY